MRLLIVLAAIFAGLTINPTPVEASAIIVMVDARVGGQNGNLRAATKFVDKYTKTRFVYGACRYDRRCITVRIDNSRKNGTAWAAWKGSKRERVHITINPASTDGYMKRLFAHEVGHAMFLEHSRYATNLMWAPIRKPNGKLVPMRFSDHQRAILKGH